MRKYGRVDGTHKAIIDALRKVGCAVYSLADLGDGMPDLLIGFQGQTYLAEVKDGRKPPSARAFTSDQRAWLLNWRGGPVVLLTSADAAIEWARATVKDPEGIFHERFRLSEISTTKADAKTDREARKAG